MVVLAPQTLEGEPQRLQLVILDTTLYIQPVLEAPGTNIKDYDKNELCSREMGGQDYDTCVGTASPAFSA